MMRSETIGCLSCGSRDLCHWARATDREYFSTSDQFDFFVCGECAAMSISPVPEKRLHEIYPPNYYSSSAGKPSIIEQFKLMLDRRLFRKILSPLEGKSLRALDVGGGTGWLLKQARAVDSRLTSTVVIDLDPAAAPAAEAAGHVYVCGRIEDYEPDEQFDLILMMNLIEHVKDPVEVLKKMKSCLKSKGRILLKTPNYDSLDARLFRRSYWGGLHCPRHWVLFTPESLTRAVERAGLHVAQIHLTQGAPFWSWSIVAILAQKGMIKVSSNSPIYLHPIVPLLMVVFAAVDFIRRPFMRTSQMFVIISHV